MIKQTISPVIIRRYLDDPDILSTFNDGERLTDLDLEDAIYLHVEDIGLFPVRTRQGIASIHAAIPRDKRGKEAVKAGKMAIDWLKDKGFFVTCQVRKDRRDVMLYACLCGLKRANENEDYIFYIA